MPSFNPVWFANQVALGLGHHFALPPEQAAELRTLADWHAATVAASEAYESQLPTPTSPWALDLSVPGGLVRHTTASGRMTVEVSGEGGTLTFFAGPELRSVGVPALSLVRQTDGRYAVAGQHEVDALPERLNLYWSESTAHTVYGPLSRQGRPIILVTYDEDPADPGVARFGVEWIRPELIFGDRRYDRLDLLFRLNNRLFGGQIVAADRTGKLAEAAGRYVTLLATAEVIRRTAQILHDEGVQEDTAWRLAVTTTLQGNGIHDEDAQEATA